MKIQKIINDIEMIKCLSNILGTVAVVTCCLFTAGCEKEKQDDTAPYLQAIPSEYDDAALGEGDAFIISVRSNVGWNLAAVDDEGKSVSWIRFEKESGNGDADVFGFISRGIKDDERSCTIMLSSEDGTIVRHYEIRQGAFVPALLKLSLGDIVKAGYPLAPGESALLPEYGGAEAEVVGLPGGNLPEGYIYITDGYVWMRIKTDNAEALKLGDRIQIDMTSGTVTKEHSGAYTAVLAKPIKVKLSGEPRVSPAYISSDAIEKYENMLVELRNVQAPENLIGNKWEGDVKMMVADEDADFLVHVREGLSFGSVGSGSGMVRGIVIDGKVWPRFADDISDFAGERIPSSVEPHIIKPISNIFKTLETNAVSNGFITETTKFTFTDEPDYSVDGASIEKVGGDEANNLRFVIGTSSFWQTCFVTVNWSEKDSWLLYKVPVTEDVWGDLEWSYSISCGTAGMFSDEWTVSWSTDGENFKPASVGSKFQLGVIDHYKYRMVAEFYIPENEAVASGFLYFKLVPPYVSPNYASKTLRVNCGSILSSKTVNTPDRGYHNVLSMENFENSTFAHNPVIGVPTYYFSYCQGAPVYTGTKGWGVVGANQAIRGCLHLSEVKGMNYLESPVLDMLKAPTDLTLTFKAAPYVNATGSSLVVNSNNISVSVIGSGEVGEIKWESLFESAPYEWHTATVHISGASSDTRIMIGNLHQDISDSAFYIDDVVIRR